LDGLNVEANEVKVVEPTGIHSRVRSRIRGDAVARIDLDEPNFSVTGIALQLQLAEPLITDASEEVVRDRLRLGVYRWFDNGR
jgi:hypothetical protein